MVLRGECPPLVTKAVQRYLALRRAADAAERDLGDWRREAKVKEKRMPTLKFWAVCHWLRGGKQERYWWRSQASNRWIITSRRGGGISLLFSQIGDRPRYSPLIPCRVLRLWAVDLGLAPPAWLGKVRDLLLWRLPDVKVDRSLGKRRRRIEVVS